MQVVPLIKKGNKQRVTEKNKRSYLDELARYRLTTKGKKQIELFIEGELLTTCLGGCGCALVRELSLFIIGLTGFVPPHLLNVFTENELEVCT